MTIWRLLVVFLATLVVARGDICEVPKIIGGNITKITVNCQHGHCQRDGKPFGQVLFKGGAKRELLKMSGINYCACDIGFYGLDCSSVCAPGKAPFCSDHAIRIPRARAEGCGQVFYPEEAFEHMDQWPVPGLCKCSYPFIGDACQFSIRQGTTLESFSKHLEQTQGKLGPSLFAQPSSPYPKPMQSICGPAGQFTPSLEQPCVCAAGVLSTASLFASPSPGTSLAGRKLLGEVLDVPRDTPTFSWIYGQLPMCSVEQTLVDIQQTLEENPKDVLQLLRDLPGDLQLEGGLSVAQCKQDVPHGQNVHQCFELARRLLGSFSEGETALKPLKGNEGEGEWSGTTIAIVVVVIVIIFAIIVTAICVCVGSPCVHRPSSKYKQEEDEGHYYSSRALQEEDEPYSSF
jgi:hypothetical protein